MTLKSRVEFAPIRVPFLTAIIVMFKVIHCHYIVVEQAVTASEVVWYCMLKVEQIGALHSDLRLGHRWLMQMGEAAHRCGVTIQYCMSQPRHLLTALLIPSVTQVACCLALLLSS